MVDGLTVRRSYCGIGGRSDGQAVAMVDGRKVGRSDGQAVAMMDDRSLGRLGCRGDGQSDGQTVRLWHWLTVGQSGG